MPTQDQQDDLAAKIDERYLTDILVELGQIPTEVPLGSQTIMEPDDLKLVHYVQNNVRPKLDALGVQHLTDVPNNQLLIRYGVGHPKHLSSSSASFRSLIPVSNNKRAPIFHIISTHLGSSR